MATITASNALSTSPPVSPLKDKTDELEESYTSIAQVTPIKSKKKHLDYPKSIIASVRKGGTLEEKGKILDEGLNNILSNDPNDTFDTLILEPFSVDSKTEEAFEELKIFKAKHAAEVERWTKAEETQVTVNELPFETVNRLFPVFVKLLKKTQFHVRPIEDIKVDDPNEAIFSISKAELQENENADKIEDRFSEASVSTIAESLRELIYEEKDEFDTSVEDGKCPWGDGNPRIEFKEEDKNFFESFWTPKGDGFFDTSLDEKRAAIANCWRYQPRTDVIAKDVTTKKQDLLFKQRQARGPLSDSAIRRRKLKMTYYFQKQYKKKSLSKKTIRLNQGILGECVKVLTREMIPAIVAKHLKYDEDFLNKWATHGEKHTSYFISSPRVTSFIFKSAKLKKLKDTQMLTWENERSKRLRKARLRIYGEDKSAYPVIKKTEKDERDVEALEYYEADNIDYSTDDKIFI